MNINIKNYKEKIIENLYMLSGILAPIGPVLYLMPISNYGDSTGYVGIGASFLGGLLGRGLWLKRHPNLWKQGKV